MRRRFEYAAAKLSSVRGPASWCDLETMAQHLASLPRDLQSFPTGIHYALIPDLQTARVMLGPSSERLRKRRGEVFFKSAEYRLRSRLRLGMHDRGEAYLFADLPLDPRDGSGQRRHLPLHLKVVRVKELILSTDQILDLTSSHKTWPDLHFREELYVALVVDRLKVAPGAKLVVRGNVAVVDIGQLDSSGHPFEIHINGTDHAAFSGARSVMADHGRDGADGAAGCDGERPDIAPSIFGPRVRKINSLDGGGGSDGASGQTGGDGQNGGMAMLADIRVGSITNGAPEALRIIGKAGNGYAGGDGGAGGEGGKGGDAAGGSKQFSISPGIPGTGGVGGAGGDGGRGGNGGLASHIFVSAPTKFHHMINLTSLPSCAGKGGKAGRGGQGGLRGNTPDNLRPRTRNTNGMNGKDGCAGKSRKGPPMWLFPTYEK